MNLWFEFLIGFWVILPAYVANGLAPLARGKKRIDAGKMFLGNELFGAGKTWEGFLFGVFCGTIFGIFQMIIYPYLSSMALSYGFVLPEMSLPLVFFISFGALFGDLVGSFIKRRIGLERGKSSPLLDQLDFVFGAFFFALFFLYVSAAAILLIMIFTPFVHIITCFIGYKIGVKEVPW